MHRAMTGLLLTAAAFGQDAKPNFSGSWKYGHTPHSGKENMIGSIMRMSCPPSLSGSTATRLSRTLVL